MRTDIEILTGCDIDALVETAINGNRSDAADAIDEQEGAAAVLLACEIMERLADRDPQTGRAILAILGERAS